MMKKKTILNCCLAAMLITGLGLALPQDRATTSVKETTSSAAMRVGTFDSRGIALAYGRSARSDCMMAKVSQIREEHEKAKEADNKDQIKKLEAQAVALQDEIHKQVFSGAPIDEILALIKDDMPNIAKEANVSMIVSGVLYSGPDAELVDITLQMGAPFEPNEKTLKSIRELIAKPLVPESDLSRDH